MTSGEEPGPGAGSAEIDELFSRLATVADESSGERDELDRLRRRLSASASADPEGRADPDPRAAGGDRAFSADSADVEETPS
jgi:hypothetical protein